MKLPAVLRRTRPNVHKNDFGHVLVLAGSEGMLGAAALCALSAMRSGAGLVTMGVAQSLNKIAQIKASNTVMTWPLRETKEHSISSRAFTQVEKRLSSFDAIALGPGLSRDPQTQKFISRAVSEISLPMVVDADALTALANDIGALEKNKGTKVLTPHPGEMANLTGLTKILIENNREKTARMFAQEFNCTVLLKGHRTVVASPKGEFYINKSGNAGMATAGSGDVLTGMIAAFLGQGLSDFQAASWGAYLHGLAGNIASRKIGKPSLIASDITEAIPMAFKQAQR